MSILNCIVFGYGEIGKVHINNILNNKNYNLLFIISPNGEEYKKISIINPEFYPKILLDNNIDCAFICSPNKYHYQQSMDCLSNNINIFVEKPLSINLKEIQNIYELAEEKKLKVFVGFNRRFDPKIIKLFKDYRNGKINKVNQVIMISRDYISNFNFNNKNDFHYDSIIHDIDTINWILGECPLNVYSYSDKNNLNVSTIMNYKSLITVTIISSRLGNYYDQSIEFLGKKKLNINDYNNSYNYYSYKERYKDSYINEIEEFYLDIINNREPKILKTDIINNHLICHNCIQSIQNKKLIELKLPKLFRNYENTNQNVIETYLQQRKFHNIDFFNTLENKYCQFTNKNTFWDLFDMLNDFIDLSDPDINLSNQHHLFQTAEAIQQDGLPKWFQFIGLIHDLGKIIFKKGNDEEGTSLKKQYSIVGDTFILDCPIPESIVFPEFNIFNSYYQNNIEIRNKKYKELTLKEKLGNYQKNCGFENIKCSFGHDEYLYQLLKFNNVSLPKQAFYIIRYHSLYLWHYENEYTFFENEKDKEMKFWLQLFQKYDLYTKVNIEKNENELKKYYSTIIDYYLPNEIYW